MVLGGYPVAMLANVAMRQWLASPQRRSRAATDWPGVRPISSARCPIPMPIPTREPLPLGRRAERAWFAPTSCIGHKATFRRMAAREPPRATNAGGPAARDECVGHECERGRSARPLAIASSAASDRRGGRVYWHTPCRPCCWSRGRGARRRGTAGWCARWGSARLALARTRRWAAAAQITPLSIAVRAITNGHSLHHIRSQPSLHALATSITYGHRRRQANLQGA